MPMWDGRGWPYGTTSSPTGPVMTNDAVPVHGITRDDLIRLVVGMQWQAAMLCHNTDGGCVLTFAWVFAGRAADLRPASTIVDEWLGVRS